MGLQPRWLLVATLAAIVAGSCRRRSGVYNAVARRLRSNRADCGRMPTKVILDVDTGTDDAVALMTAALSPDLELVGATSVNGNTTIDFTTENTLRVFDFIGMPEVPVYRGMDRPLVRTDVKRGMADADPRRHAGPAGGLERRAGSSRATPSTG